MSKKKTVWKAMVAHIGSLLDLDVNYEFFAKRELISNASPEITISMSFWLKYLAYEWRH